MGLNVEGGQTAEVEAADTDEVQQDNSQLGEMPDGTKGGGTPPEEEDGEEVTVSIGEEDASPEQEQERSAPQWVRDLRKTSREQARRLRELEEENKALKQPTKAVEVGPKPTLESCDYDEARYERDLEAWHERKRDADAKAREEREAQERQQKSFQERLEAYEVGKKALKVADFSEAEDVIKASMSQTQQGVIVHAAKKPELVVYALGKNDKARAELAAITDPVKFAYALGELETKLKVTTRKSAPPPERRVTGSAPGTAIDSTLAKLEADAERTGDRSKVIAYKRAQKQKQAT